MNTKITEEGVGQMNCHHTANCASIHLVVFVAVRIPANELLQWIQANNISVMRKRACESGGRNTVGEHLSNSCFDTHVRINEFRLESMHDGRTSLRRFCRTSKKINVSAHKKTSINTYQR